MNNTETEVRKTVDMLNKDSVSILTQTFTIVDNVEKQFGEDHRCAYVNSTEGRTDLEANEPEAVVNAVLTIWG